MDEEEDDSLDMKDSKEILVKSIKYPTKLGSELYKLQRSGLYCELYLRTDAGEDWPVHSCVAVASSAFIASILSSVDAGSDKTSWGFAIPLEKVTFQTLENVTKFIYTGEVLLSSSNQLQDLLHAADYLQIPDLVEACSATGAEDTNHCNSDKSQSLCVQDYHGHSAGESGDREDQIDESPLFAEETPLPECVNTFTIKHEEQTDDTNEELITNNSVKDITETGLEKIIDGLDSSETSEVVEKSIISPTELGELFDNTCTKHTLKEEPDAHVTDLNASYEDDGTDFAAATDIETHQSNTIHGQTLSLEFVSPAEIKVESLPETHEKSHAESNKEDKRKSKFDPRVLDFLRRGKKQKKKINNQAELKDDSSHTPAKIALKRKREVEDSETTDYNLTKRVALEEIIKIKPSAEKEYNKASVSKDDYKFQCGECRKTFVKKSDVIKHMNFLHPIIDDDGNEQDLKVMHIDRDDLNLKEHKCLVCPRSFSKRSNWVQHLNFTHRMKMVVTDEKNKKSSLPESHNKFQDSQDLSDTECEENHVKEQEGLTVLYRNDVSAPKVTSWQERLEKSQKPKVPRERVNKKCPMCGMYFRFKGPYEDHILKHDNPAPYKCGICSASFKSKASFNAHMLHTHGIGDAKYNCSKCTKSFASISRLERHERTHSSRERVHVCELCGKSYMDEAVLTMHKKHVHMKECIKCEMCGKNVSKKRIKEHMNLHTGEIMYPCTYCEAVYKQKKSLDCHMRFKHDVGVDPSENRDCEICHMHFSNAVTLDMHMKRHLREKKCKCTSCGLAFLTKGELKSHELCHLRPEERPWSCSICFKTFNKEYGLKSHMLIHDTNKPLSCGYCGKGFRWKNKLKEHIRTHTGEKPHKCRHCASYFADCATRRYHEKKCHPDKTTNTDDTYKRKDQSSLNSNFQSVNEHQILFTEGENVQLIVATDEELKQRFGVIPTDDNSVLRNELVSSSSKDRNLVQNFFISNPDVRQPARVLTTQTRTTDIVDINDLNIVPTSRMSDASQHHITLEDSSGSRTNYILTGSDVFDNEHNITTMEVTSSSTASTQGFVIESESKQYLDRSALETYYTGSGNEEDEDDDGNFESENTQMVTNYINIPQTSDIQLRDGATGKVSNDFVVSNAVVSVVNNPHTDEDIILEDDNEEEVENGEKLVVSRGELQDTHMVIASEAGVQLALIAAGGGVEEAGSVGMSGDAGDDKVVGEEGEFVQYVLEGDEGQQIEYIIQQGQQTRL